MPDLRTGSIGISESLRKFVAEFPYEREPILEFVMQTAKAIPAGARVADVGAGDAPFRELFAHTRYATLDWAESVHEGAPSSDIVASADAIPVRDGAFDAVLLTQVLEHVPEPAGVLTELHRILAKRRGPLSDRSADLGAARAAPRLLPLHLRGPASSARDGRLHVD